MCSLEFPDLERNVWQPLRDQGVVVVGLNAGGFYAGDDDARISKFIEETGVTFRVARDEAGTFREYSAGSRLSPFPLDVLVDRTGTIRYLTREYDADVVRNEIDRLLAE